MVRQGSDLGLRDQTVIVNGSKLRTAKAVVQGVHKVRPRDSDQRAQAGQRALVRVCNKLGQGGW